MSLELFRGIFAPIGTEASTVEQLKQEKQQLIADLTLAISTLNTELTPSENNPPLSQSEEFLKLKKHWALTALKDNLEGKRLDKNEFLRVKKICALAGAFGGYKNRTEKLFKRVENFLKKRDAIIPADLVKNFTGFSCNKGKTA